MTWDGIRGTLQWMLMLLLVTVIAAGAVGLHFWSQKDVLIHNAVTKAIETIFVDCDVSFQSANLVNGSQLVITELNIQSQKSGTPLAKVPQLTVTVDGKLLQDSRRILVKRIELNSPQLFATRNAEGLWNWQELTPPKPKQEYSPAVVIKNGQIRIGLQSIPNGPVHSILCQGIELQISPEARQRYEIVGRAVADSLGPVTLNGLLDAQTGEWKLAGSAGTIRINEPMLEKTGLWIPEVGAKLAELHQTPQYLARQERVRQNQQLRTVSSNAQGIPLAIAPEGTPQGGESFIRADLKLQFSAGRTSKDAPLDYSVQAEIEHGQLSDLFLPIPLYDVRAKIEATPNTLKIENFKASNNQSSLFIDGVAQRVGLDWSKNFVVKATHLKIDQRIQSVLPNDLLRLYQLLSPSGIFDLDVDVSQLAGKDWSGKLRKFTARDCRIVHDYFRYPVEQVSGEIVHQRGGFQIRMNGQAAGNPLQLTGSFGDGTQNRDAEFSIVVNNVPIDDMFINAFGRREQAGVKSAIESLRMKGVVDLSARFVRDETTQNKFEMQLVGNVRESSLNFVGFPYELENFSGDLSFDGLKGDVWYFSDLKARHGHAHLNGSGRFDSQKSPGQLSLDLRAVRVPIDGDLKKASLVSAPHISTVWDDFALGGTIDIDKIALAWSPGTPTAVTLNGIQWKDGTITPASFPYKWTDVVGALDWDGQRLNIHSLHGWHGSSYLEINGADPKWPAFVAVPPTGEVAWEVHFGDLKLVQAKFDDELERALPEAISAPLKAMDLQGNVNVHLTVDMRGWVSDEEIVTARWNLQAILKNNSLIAGVPLKNVTGKVDITDGLWDGQKLRMEGAIDLEYAIAMGIPFSNVRSPFHLEESRLVVGKPKFINPPVQFTVANPYANKQLRADLYDGQIGFDAAILLADRPELTQYQAEVNINDVELATWAADQFKNARNLKGKVNGLISMRGMGPSAKAMVGKGWVQIVPAAIMDLPAFAQMFSLINFRPVGDTAFNYSYGEFDIQNELLDFSRIELRGDALNLIGKGFVGFAGGGQSLINLSFDSRPNTSVRILRPLTKILGNNWIRVQVMGTVSEPVAVVQPRIGPLDDAFREFTEAIEKGQTFRPPSQRSPVR
ncbi:hypothetical protein [Thalassoglobus sp.]|uniref:hypothetical protein n=1 Tax=Thalassoglobus sp. TaxID=2795869 RepID=UPI003AA9E219